MTTNEAKRALASVTQRLATNEEHHAALLDERRQLVRVLWHCCDRATLAELAGVTERRLYQVRDGTR